MAKLTPGGDPVRPRAARVEAALGIGFSPRWVEALSDLLAVLGDDDSENSYRTRPIEIDSDQLDAMRRNWPCPDDHALRRRIVDLRILYDWPALVAAINVCPGVATRKSSAAEYGSLQLNDLFNVLDLHQQSGHGFPASDGYFLTPQRVLGAQKALRLLLYTLMYVDWHARCRTDAGIGHHYNFAVALTRRMQRQGIHLAGELGTAGLDTKDFIVGDTGFVSMNWDPLGLWAQFVANRNLNKAGNVPHVGTPARRLWTFHDLGHFVAGPRVEKLDERSKVWEPMNESSARQLNDPEHGARVCIRVSKYLFPHGSLWWRECPNCGQLSSFMGDKWEMGSETLLPPPPLRAFADGFVSWHPLELCKWNKGEVDARACVHCDAMTFAHHTPLITQTNLKTAPPPFLEDIQRDMRVVVQKADHVVLLGYSLPPDDVVYRAFFAARTSRERETVRGRRRKPVRCSVVTWCKEPRSDWTHLDANIGDAKLPQVVESAKSLFGRENVRFYDRGFPAVALDGGTIVTDAAVERLLNWDSAKHL